MITTSTVLTFQIVDERGTILRVQKVGSKRDAGLSVIINPAMNIPILSREQALDLHQFLYENYVMGGT